MQEHSSTVSYSPSFSYYASGEFAAAAAENQSYNIADPDDEDGDFEFETSPFHEDAFAHFPTFTKDIVVMVNKKDDDVSVTVLPGAENILEDFSGSCLWSPFRSQQQSELSSRTPKRCRLKKFLTRSHSDGAVLSPSASKRCCLKDFMKRSHSDGSDTSTSTSPPAVKGKAKTASCKVAEGDNRQRKSYLPYRQDLIGVFFAGARRLRH